MYQTREPAARGLLLQPLELRFELSAFMRPTGAVRLVEHAVILARFPRSRRLCRCRGADAVSLGEGVARLLCLFGQPIEHALPLCLFTFPCAGDAAQRL